MKPGIRINKSAGTPTQTRSHGRRQMDVPTSPESVPPTDYAPVPQEKWEAALERVLTEDDELLRRLA